MFSCKAHICPSCAARRMEDAAAHVVRNVFPAVAVRQWVLSYPRRLRFLAAREPRLASRLLAIFTGAASA
ncbi:MAG TPA: transposase zinc-binding domain-containing protein [Myxococcales bacterium]|nr:transposase zinc-binding domain-containing protein [Myxococcales bacterium]